MGERRRRYIGTTLYAETVPCISFLNTGVVERPTRMKTGVSSVGRSGSEYADMSSERYV